jgi:hypothetical protein
LATIHQSKHFVVQHFRASAHVRVVRSDVPFGSVSEAVARLDDCRLAVLSIDCTNYGILFDWRSAPLSTDPQLHKALVERVDELASPFPRRAFLVRGGVGAMQVNRLGRTSTAAAPMTVFADEAQALQFLTAHR